MCVSVYIYHCTIFFFARPKSPQICLLICKQSIETHAKLKIDQWNMLRRAYGMLASSVCRISPAAHHTRSPRINFVAKVFVEYFPPQTSVRLFLRNIASCRARARAHQCTTTFTTTPLYLHVYLCAIVYYINIYSSCHYYIANRQACSLVSVSWIFPKVLCIEIILMHGYYGICSSFIRMFVCVCVCVHIVFSLPPPSSTFTLRNCVLFAKQCSTTLFCPSPLRNFSERTIFLVTN